jgi:nucleoside-diphosphate-sugar epimerase
MSTEITDEDLILVTGASGYIAAHIVKQLMENGYRVRGTVRNLTDSKKCDPLRKLVENPKHPLELVEADLLNESSWPNAVAGCTYVVHTASPFPNAAPKDEMELIKPAVDGTLFVLKACALEDSTVKRVVLTSSVASVSGDVTTHGYTYSEKDWSDPNKIGAYSKSKVLAEKSAWDFVKENSHHKFELTTINPGFVMVGF